LLSATHATARWQGVAAWKLLPRVIYTGLSARHRAFEPVEDMRTARERRFVDAAVLQEFERTGPGYLMPPWLDPSARIPPGKIRHCDLMYLATSNTSPLEHAEDPDWIMPLASQPLVELFLRIPTYVLTAGGRDRMVARRAFESELPPEILSRRTKVTGNNLILDIFRHNRALYKETLLDGVLVEERLLDRQKVEKFFASVDDPGTKGLGELLLSHFNLELWLRSWKRSARSTAGDVAA
jgi:asparagine synthase (glutamine-hydrolysing)